MGIALWLVCGVLAWLIARLIPFGRGGPWLELTVTIPLALLLGTLATALDFGGWREPDWRAGAFVFFGSFAAAGAIRALQSSRSTGGRS